MKGLRTILVGLGVAAGPVALQYLGGVDWSTIVPPPWDMVAAGAIMIAMRFATNTPIGQPK